MESLPQDKSGYLLLQSYILLLSLCWGYETGSHVPQPGFELAGQTGLEDLTFPLLPPPPSQAQLILKSFDLRG